MMFWLICGVMTVLAVAALLFPLMRPSRPAPSHGRQGIAVYRDQLAEVERDRERGLLDAEQAAAATTEIERRILTLASDLERDPDEAESAPAAGQPRAVWLAPALGVLVPAGVLALYFGLGAPGTPDLPLAERPERVATADIATMAERLAKRLYETGGSAQDWGLLARTYAELGRHFKAAEATREAIRLGQDDAETRSFLGEMLVAAARGEVVQEARNNFAAALEQDPNNTRALYYGGLALAQDGRLQEAYELWTELAGAAPPEAPWLPMLRRQIANLAGDLGIEPPDQPASAAVAPAAPGPSAADVEAARDMSETDRATFIRSMVEGLAERLESEPDNLDGWLRLSRAYLVLGEPDKAESALARAETLVAALPEQSAERAAVEAARQALDATR